MINGLGLADDEGFAGSEWGIGSYSGLASRSFTGTPRTGRLDILNVRVPVSTPSTQVTAYVNPVNANTNPFAISNAPSGGSSWLAKILGTVQGVVNSNNQAKSIVAQGYQPQPNSYNEGGMNTGINGGSAQAVDFSARDRNDSSLSLDKGAKGIGDFIQANGLLLAIGGLAFVLYKSGRPS